MMKGHAKRPTDGTPSAAAGKAKLTTPFSTALRIPLLLLLASTMTSTTFTARAFPTGSACCASGPNAVGGSHLLALDSGEEIDSGGYGLLLDGGFVEPESDFTVCRGEPSTLTLDSDDGIDFLGFMIRVTAPGALAPASTSDVQIMPNGEDPDDATCDSPPWGTLGTCPPNVSAVTHKDKDPKSSVEVTLTLNGNLGSAYDLEITVVRMNSNNGGGDDGWFYSRYSVVIEDCDSPQFDFQIDPGQLGGDEEKMFCTQEVKECPDGSWVARDNTNGCEFKPCPSEEGGGLVCLDDAMQCDDGSFVARDPANDCSFAPCPSSPNDAVVIEGPEEIFCPADIQECQDGTTVSRDPQNDCTFPPCPEETETAFCTADAKECGDGSYVSRDPENDCNFSPCPEDTEIAFCAADAKECGDGSYVWRVPENDCAFSPCPEETEGVDGGLQVDECDDGTVFECEGGIFVPRVSTGGGDGGCEFAECPSCIDDEFVCDDGTAVRRDPGMECQFSACPDGNTTPPDNGDGFMGTTDVNDCAKDVKECEAGNGTVPVVVGRDPDNGCEFFPCPSAPSPDEQEQEPENDENLCIDGVFTCPDGSFVTRDEMNNCEYFPCPEDPNLKGTADSGGRCNAKVEGMVVRLVLSASFFYAVAHL